MSAYKVRIYTPFFPYPPRSGASQVIYEQARRYAAAGHATELVFWKDSSADVQRKLTEPFFKPFLESISLIPLLEPELQGVPFNRWPKTTPPVTPQSPVTESRASRLTRTVGSVASLWASPEVYHYPPALASPSYRSILKPVHLAIYHYSFAYVWLRSQPDSIRGIEPQQVVHLHNLESELARLRARSSSLGEAALHHLNATKLALHEKQLATLASELWFVSPEDLRRFEENTPSVSLKFVPPEFDPDLQTYRTAIRAGVSPPQAAGFIGALDFKPNQDSLEWIVDRVFPALRDIGYPGKFLVAGKNAPSTLRQAACAYDFVEWLGFVEDPEAFWSGISILLSPHLSGSGTRIKLLEAIASGIPVLTNTGGMALLPSQSRQSALLLQSDDPREWARIITSYAAGCRAPR